MTKWVFTVASMGTVYAVTTMGTVCLISMLAVNALFFAVAFLLRAGAFFFTMRTATMWVCLYAMRRSVAVAFTFTAFRFR